MTKKNYYAIRKGRNIGIFEDWGEVNELIKGYSGAEYKKFKTKEQAQKYLEEKVDNTEHSCEEEISIDDINKEIESKISQLDSETAIAFVDGSYSPNIDGKQKYGFGAIIFTEKNKKNKLYKGFVKGKFIESRNVAGEIEGVKEVILWSIDNNIKKVTIYYDYEGIEKWANGSWKSKKPISIDYARFIQEKSNMIEIEFVHTKAHMGIKYNEEADELAKMALLSQNYKRHGDGSIYFYYNSKDDWYNIINDLNTKYPENKISIEERSVKEYHDILTLEADKESLIIHCYKGNKSYLQGKQGDLYNKIIYRAIENLPNQAMVIDTLKNYYITSITENDIVRELNNRIPSLPKNYNDQKHYNNLLTCIFNIMTIANMPDFTQLLHPIFRSTEYYLHRILNDRLDQKTTRRNGSNNFVFFSINPEDGRFYYNSNKKDLSENQIDLLNKFYNYYSQRRNPYMHWCENSIDTNVIEDRETAIEIIDEGLNLIEEYYIIF